jgi:hypothetical protein
MNEIKKCSGCGVELIFPHKHEENCPYKDGVYPAQYIYEGAPGSDSVNNFLREEEHGEE